MPKIGDIDQTYPSKLKKIGITLLDHFDGAKKHHLMKCDVCNHEWIATPIAKLQTFRKHKVSGCPKCHEENRWKQSRKENLKRLQERGLKILSNYDGRYTEKDGNTIVRVSVKNNKCGHIFETDSKNLLANNVTCPICAREYKNSVLLKSSKARSVEYHKTADLWNSYRHKVYMKTRSNYHKHKASINPNNLPRGKAGQEGAYHLVHIVPVRWCFEHYVPIDVCAHHSNLQMLHWNDNVGSRDRLKENIQIPLIFQPYILLHDK
ncbi:MAG: hypothetical protein KGI25_04425 [Thaumarchaeota archaeon]|nr:hypothetical protein [Nitrososphaerota archaeon]